MKLTNSLSNLIKTTILTEASLSPDMIYNKYYKNRFERDTFDEIVKSDPGTIVKNGEIRKIGKYAKLLLSWVENNTLMMEDLPNATEYLGFVYKHNIPVDSKEITGISKLFKLVKKYIITKDSDFQSILSELPKDQYTKMFESEDWVIYVPKTEKAACHLGVGTRWCTTWGKESLDPKFRDRENRFHDYTFRGESLYIIINKHDTSEKYQFHFRSEQYMDKNDVPINPYRFLNNNPDILKFFFQGIDEKLPQAQFEVERKRLKILSGKYLKSFVLHNIDRFNNSDRLLSLIQSECGELIGYVDGINVVECGDDIEFTIDGNFSTNNILDPDDNAYDSERFMYWSILSSEYSYREHTESMINDYTYEFRRYKLADKNNESQYIEWLREYYLNETKTDITKIPDFSRLIMELFNGNFSDMLTEAAIDLTYETYEPAVNDLINNIENYISIRPYRNSVDITIPKVPFTMFINEHKQYPSEFTSSQDTIYMISEYFIDYVLNKFDLESMVYGYYRLTDLPKEKFFEVYQEYLENVDDPFLDFECDEMKEFRLFIEKNFEFDDKKLRYVFTIKDPNSENSILIIVNNIQKLCDNGKINITYVGLNGKSKTGHIDFRVLPHYMNNYKLFEEILNFNRFVV